LKISIHQAAYLPWLGYLSRIAESDVFVFLDTVQFEKNSFTNRNRIKTSSGSLWLTVPVLQKGHLSKSCFDLEIDSKQDWQKKHLRSIEMSYSKTAQFSSRFLELQKLFANSHERLADLCYWQLLFWLSQFKINTPIIRASSLPVYGNKSDLVLALCKYLNATEYISGPLGKDYLNVDDFQQANVLLSYQDYPHPIYPQLYGEFIAGMSVVDSWMNCLDPALLIKRG
jgi:hypothetical protein